MVTTPPPSRYKIVEKAGRLITIDTWADNHVAAKEIRRVDPQASSKPLSSFARHKPDSDVTLKFAHFMTRGEKDDRGNFILRTTKIFDAAAPRAFRLTADQARELGGIGLLLAIAFAVLLIIALLTDFFIVLFVSVFLGFRLSPAFLKPLMKPLLAKAEQIE